MYLQECLEFLRRSASAFDDGAWGEAKRLAVTVRVLLHNTRESRSLLVQLKLLPDMGFLCTARPDAPNLIWGQDFRLVNVLMSGTEGVRFSAPLDNIPPMPRRRHKIVLFPKWWNEDVIRTKAARFCRRDVVLALSNKVGGAHVDPLLDEPFAELLRGNPLGITSTTKDDVEQRVPDIELHTMRQIAHEVLKSIERKLAKG